MEPKKNLFKQRLLAGDPLIGLWLSLASPLVAEALSEAGFDWLVVDGEHSPLEVSEVLPMLQALAAGGAAPVVRPAWNDKVLIKRLLDIGAQTLLIPYVQTAEEAAAAVAATRYPPEGLRGVAGGTRASRYGRAKDYLRRANDEICVLIQVETAEALRNLEAIAAVPGVDGIFIGPSDLAASLGHLGDTGAPAVQEALHDAVQRMQAAGVPAGILSVAQDTTDRYLDWGYRFVAVGTDMGVLVKGADALRSAVAGRVPLV